MYSVNVSPEYRMTFSSNKMRKKNPDLNSAFQNLDFSFLLWSLSELIIESLKEKEIFRKRGYYMRLYEKLNFEVFLLKIKLQTKTKGVEALFPTINQYNTGISFLGLLHK
jgi:hypothetical protein